MADPAVTLLVGDVRERLAQLPDESVHCVVTSPPYWGLRDYGVTGQIGMEPTLGEHLATMIEVFREVRRVLRRDGTCWVNYGDCYAATPNGRAAKDVVGDDRTFRDKPFSTIGPINRGEREGFSNGSATGRWGGGNNPAGGVLKPKDLCMIPNRFAIAMQDDGWWVRSEIIWHKPNPMPESITDRPATAHEKVFLFTKAGRYFYDAAAVRTACKSDAPYKMPDGRDTRQGAHGSFHRDGREKGRVANKQRGHSRPHAGFNERWDGMTPEEQRAGGANLKNVWPIATKPFTGAHFATFPPELPEICIKAGCPVGGTVLDPFGGAGTTGLVAAKLLRNATLIELNADYAAIALGRLRANLVSVELVGMPEPEPAPLFSEAAE